MHVEHIAAAAASYTELSSTASAPVCAAAEKLQGFEVELCVSQDQEMGRPAPTALSKHAHYRAFTAQTIEDV